MKQEMTERKPSPLSLGTRISMSYVFFLIRSLLWNLPIFAAIFWICTVIHVNLTIHDIIEASPVQNGCIWVRGFEITAGDPSEPLGPIGWSDGLAVWNASASTEEGTVWVRYVLDTETELFWVLLCAMTVLDILRMVVLIQNSERIGRHALRPITEIAETARRLSASNLSERIDLHDARGELAELSDILNDMLNRIESAYNTQKQFVSDASHELRTPISVIQGYADMLNRWGKSDPEVCDEAISAIRSEAQGMKELVEKLLFLARHDNQTHTYEKVYFDAGELTDEVFRDTCMLTDCHQVLHGDIHRVIISGDRSALKQALRIFVDNAIKYTEAGGQIVLSCRKEEEFCRITVEDSGIGIEEKELPRIFERFYRTRQSGASTVDGHGLGLSIVRIIVRAHGGRIEVQSRVGAGSRFHMLLPL